MQPLVGGLKLEENCRWVESKRKNVDFCPKDVGRCDNFLSSTRNAAACPFVSFYKKHTKLRVAQASEMQQAVADNGGDEGDVFDAFD
jgi:hypothetical protein